MNRIRIFCFLAALSLLSLAIKSQTVKHGPHMGWSSWNTYGVNINESLIKSQADAMVSNGFSDAGYTYINIDDGYFGGRDEETGCLLPHPTRFPNGLKTLCDYVHSKGLKIGIYSDVGINTCGSEGSGDLISLGCGMYNHHDQDMDWWFVDNGFDFIKVDYCGGRQLENAGQDVNDEHLYGLVFDALDRVRQKVDRDLSINVCRWSFPGTWAAGRANSWRTTGDIYCAWESVKGIINQNLYLSAFSAPGSYNDMDMLEVGRGLTTEEDRTHFSMWCIMNSPLMIGCNMVNISNTTKKLLTNSELISLNQDTLFQQAYVADNQDGVYMLVKDILHRNDTMRAVAIYNSTDEERKYEIVFDKIDLGGKVKIRSLTYGMTLTKEYEQSYSLTLPAHATRVFRFDAQERKERTLYEAETAYLSQFHQSGKTNASFVGCDDASGGMKVCYLGNRPDNDLRWKNVYTKQGGKYKCTIYYYVSGSRKMTVSVNGGLPKTYTTQGTSFDSDRRALTFETELQPGDNEIRLYSNSTSYCPDIDCMTVEWLEDLTALNETPSAVTTSKRAVDLQGRVIENVDALPDGTIYIKNREKIKK
ncbi:MAG: alpha-galactosidase [Prevotellaceae bacterium]|nr:alpha-galactosidase [Prevotellaceae bacterium]